MNNPIRLAAWVAFAVLLFAAPVRCAAKENCPWMNDATAGGYLGGSVRSVVTHPTADKDDATCEFLRSGSEELISLRIEVQTMSDLSQFARYRARCGADAVAMRAVGNEAVSCAGEGNKKQMSEQVVGRVRNRAFIVHVVANRNVLDPTVVRDRAAKVAEQVAGILF